MVHYYPRITGWKGLHFALPYIISSRNHKQLLQNLLSDDDPILFEGLHTTFYANHAALANRNKILRAHNIESEYYQSLARNTNQLFEKLYYSFESIQLKRYENNLAHFDAILSISEHDYIYHQAHYPSSKQVLLPAFHPFSKIESKLGKGTYCLFHGNLSVAENEKSCKFLIEEVFSEMTIPLIITGKNPSDELQKLANGHIQIIANPSEEQLKQLIADAHIHVLPSFQHTGLKLKLLFALFAGRFCISDDVLIESDLLNSITLVTDANSWIQTIGTLMNQDFTVEDLEVRKKALVNFSNQINVEKILSLI
ncbi:MAG: glycosyltransferase [Bacteroidetes bacterium]|nr:glycosyltransferase [Bacteroidota bacterium]